MKTAAVACITFLYVLPCPTALGAAENDRAAVAAAIHGVFRAAERKELDQLVAYHDFGPAFTKFDEFGLGREDGPTTRAAERRAVEAVKSFRAEVQELKVDLLGVAAVATFILAYQAETGAGAVANKLRSTVVLSRHSGSWKIVHEHYSRLTEEH